MFLRYKKTYPFREVSFLQLSKESRSSKNYHYYVYPIRIILNTEKKISLKTDLRDYLSAREKAEFVARICGFSFQNKEVSDKILLPSEIDKSFADKLKSNLSAPKTQASKFLRSKQESSNLILTNTYQTPFWLSLVPFLLLCAMGIPFYILFMTQVPEQNTSMRLALHIIIAAPIILYLTQTLLSKSKSSTLKIKSDSISFQNVAFFSQEKEIYYKDILDLDREHSQLSKPLNNKFKRITGNPLYGLSIIGTQEKIVISPLSCEEDVNYLYELLCYEISKRI